MRSEDVPDVIIVKKVFDRQKRAARRRWKLKRLVVDGNIVGQETASVADEFESFMEDIEEDPAIREKINIYKDSQKLTIPIDTDDDSHFGEDAPTLAEMLDDLDLDRDVEME